MLSTAASAVVGVPWSAAEIDKLASCPRGSYLDYRQRAKAAAALLASQRSHVADGWLPYGLPGKGREYARRGVVSVWCSDNWPKPAVCQHDPLRPMMPDQIFYETMPSGGVGLPLRSVFGNRIEFIHNFKAASSTVSAFFSCAYGREMDSDAFDLSVFVVRDPIDRFISAVGELLRRYVNDHCPEDVTGAVKCSHDMMMSPAFTDLNADRSDFLAVREETLDEAMKSTLWWPFAQTNGVGLHVVTQLLTAFIGDIQCCHSSYAMDHFNPQSLFATYASRGIDVVISTADLEAGLEQVLARVPSVAPAGQCKLSREKNSASTNKASAAGDNLPSTAELRAALTDDHIRQLCEIYAQDYSCFAEWLPLPPECPPRAESKLPPLPPAPPLRPPPSVATHTEASPPPPALAMPPLPPNEPDVLTIGEGRHKPSEPPELIPAPSGSADQEGSATQIGFVSLLLLLQVLVVVPILWLKWWQAKVSQAPEDESPQTKRRCRASGRLAVCELVPFDDADFSTIDDGDDSVEQSDLRADARRSKRRDRPRRHGRRSRRSTPETESPNGLPSAGFYGAALQDDFLDDFDLD